ncbi:hypothetical protein [Rhodovarius sp.]
MLNKPSFIPRPPPVQWRLLCLAGHPRTGTAKLRRARRVAMAQAQ